MNDLAPKLVWAILALLGTLVLATMGQLYINMKSTDDEQNQRILDIEKYQYENRWRIEILERHEKGK